jgi:hypothetical protein
VPFGPADGATVPELPEDCPMLHGGGRIKPIEFRTSGIFGI